MTMPKMKRIRVSTDQELRNVLAKKSGASQEVMIVTGNAKSRENHISSERVRQVAQESGWQPGPSYSLSGNLLGHVVRHS